MRRALLISNVPATEHSSRGADFETRAELLEDEGWEIVFGVVAKPYFLSFPISVLRCLSIARSGDIDVITSVNNPAHLHVVGLLVSLLTGIPWVAELRDPIVYNPDRNPRALRAKLYLLVEKLVVRWADRIVWGDGIQMQEDYFETNHGVESGDVQKLPFRGYRHEEFAKANSIDYDCFTITYAGSFYDGWIEPYTFFEGLNHHLRAFGNEIRVQFYGDWRPEYDDAILELGIDKHVVHREFVSRSNLIPVLKGSNALLYIGGLKPENRLNVPSKIFDYIGANSPILAIVDPDFRVAKLIREEELGIVAPYDDPKAIAEALECLRTTQQIRPPTEVDNQFDRRRKIKALANTYRDVASSASTDIESTETA